MIMCIQNLVSVSLCSQDIEEKLNFDTNQGPLLANLWRMSIYNLNVDLVYDNVYTNWSQ